MSDLRISYTLPQASNLNVITGIVLTTLKGGTGFSGAGGAFGGGSGATGNTAPLDTLVLQDQQDLVVELAQQDRQGQQDP